MANIIQRCLQSYLILAEGRRALAVLKNLSPILIHSFSLEFNHPHKMCFLEVRAGLSQYKDIHEITNSVLFLTSVQGRLVYCELLIPSVYSLRQRI